MTLDPGSAHTRAGNLPSEKKMSSDDLTQNLSANNEDDRSTQPTITAVFRLLQDMDQRVNHRLGGVETRLETVETRLEAVETRLETVETRLGTVETRLETMETRLKTMETRLETMETRFETMETRFDQLESGLARNFASIDERFIELATAMKNGFIQFSDTLADQMDQTRLHRSADYDDLLRRMRRLESKSS